MFASTGPKPAERRGSGARPAPSRPFPASSALRPELLDADAEVTGPGQRSAASVPSARCAQGFQAACRWQGGQEGRAQRSWGSAGVFLCLPPARKATSSRPLLGQGEGHIPAGLVHGLPGQGPGLLAPHAPFWKFWGCNEPHCARSFLEPLKP